jgi:DNA-binding LytR/AlgR family response regulator
MMRVVIADDEPIARRKLAALVAEQPQVRLQGVAADGLEAGELVRVHRPDLLILDIEMPGLSGLHLARTLAAAETPPQVIFATAFGHYGVAAFEVAATDYLLKPLSRERLAQALRRARRRRVDGARLAEVQATARAPSEAEWRDEVWAPVKGGLARVAAADIVWIEGAGDYVILHTAERSFMLRAGLTALEGVFDPSRIRRIHRSAMVNLAAVHRIRRRGRHEVVELRDGAEAPIGPSYAAALPAALRA